MRIFFFSTNDKILRETLYFTLFFRWNHGALPVSHNCDAGQKSAKVVGGIIGQGRPQNEEGGGKKATDSCESPGSHDRIRVRLILWTALPTANI